ncbi:hypothetical protein ACWD04_33000 [Streptomyces sp. NPDC002911]
MGGEAGRASGRHPAQPLGRPAGRFVHLDARGDLQDGCRELRRPGAVRLAADRRVGVPARLRDVAHRQCDRGPQEVHIRPGVQHMPALRVRLRRVQALHRLVQVPGAVGEFGETGEQERRLRVGADLPNELQRLLVGRARLLVPPRRPIPASATALATWARRKRSPTRRLSPRSSAMSSSMPSMP